MTTCHMATWQHDPAINYNPKPQRVRLGLIHLVHLYVPQVVQPRKTWGHVYLTRVLLSLSPTNSHCMSKSIQATIQHCPTFGPAPSDVRQPSVDWPETHNAVQAGASAHQALRHAASELRKSRLARTCIPGRPQTCWCASRSQHGSIPEQTA